MRFTAPAAQPTCVAVFFLALTLICGVHAARGEQRAGTAYVFGGVVVAWQQGVTTEDFRTYVAAPGGTTAGFALGGGVFLSPLVSVEGEFARTGIMKAREPSRYDMTFNEERRDSFLWGVLRFHVPRGTAIHLEPVVGIGLVRHDAWSQVEYARPYLNPPTVEISERVQDDPRWRAALAVGGDLRLGNAHLALLPSFRVHYALDDDSWESRYPGGLPSRWTIRPGILVRAEF